jgi:hypothetical protein
MTSELDKYRKALVAISLADTIREAHQIAEVALWEDGSGVFTEARDGMASKGEKDV